MGSTKPMPERKGRLQHDLEVEAGTVRYLLGCKDLSTDEFLNLTTKWGRGHWEAYAYIRLGGELIPPFQAEAFGEGPEEILEVAYRRLAREGREQALHLGIVDLLGHCFDYVAPSDRSLDQIIGHLLVVVDRLGVLEARGRLYALADDGRFADRSCGDIRSGPYGPLQREVLRTILSLQSQPEQRKFWWLEKLEDEDIGAVVAPVAFVGLARADVRLAIRSVPKLAQHWLDSSNSKYSFDITRVLAGFLREYAGVEKIPLVVQELDSATDAQKKCVLSAFDNMRLPPDAVQSYAKAKERLMQPAVHPDEINLPSVRGEDMLQLFKQIAQYHSIVSPAVRETWDVYYAHYLLRSVIGDKLPVIDWGDTLAQLPKLFSSSTKEQSERSYRLEDGE